MTGRRCRCCARQESSIGIPPHVCHGFHRARGIFLEPPRAEPGGGSRNRRNCWSFGAFAPSKILEPAGDKCPRELSPAGIVAIARSCVTLRRRKSCTGQCPRGGSIFSGG